MNINKEERNRLFEALKHGDQDHQDWLFDAINAFFDGKEIPHVKGLNDKDQQILSLRMENNRLKSCRIQNFSVSEANYIKSICQKYLEFGKDREVFNDKLLLSVKRALKEVVFDREIEMKNDPDSHIVVDFSLPSALEAIRYNIEKANQSWYSEQSSYNKSMYYLRKIAAICVRMDEKYGMPKREE